MKPELFLIPAVFIVLVSGCTSGILTPERVLGMKDSLLGQRISVIGAAGISDIRCTLIECGEDNPCCNACGGSLLLEGNREKILLYGEYEGENVGCGGNECELTCYPLEIGKKYEVTGIWNKTRFEYYLEIESFREIA